MGTWNEAQEIRGGNGWVGFPLVLFAWGRGEVEVWRVEGVERRKAERKTITSADCGNNLHTRTCLPPDKLLNRSG